MGWVWFGHSGVLVDDLDSVTVVVDMGIIYQYEE